MFEVGLKKFLWLKKVKNTVLWTYFINDLNEEKLLKGFTKTNSKNKSKRVKSWKSNKEINDMEKIMERLKERLC